MTKQKIQLITILLAALFAPAAMHAGPPDQAAIEAQLAEQFKHYDKNGDGKITRDEAPAIFEMFRAADANGDGALTFEEIRDYLRKRAQAALQPDATKPPAFDGLSDEVIERRFRELDLNHDGKLSGAELNQARWLKRLDLNGDGEVTLEEAKEFFHRGGFSIKPAVASQPAPMLDSTASPRQEPKRLKAGECGIGTLVPDLTFADLDGKPHKLSELEREHGLVVALASTSCPVSKRYLPSLARIEKDYASKGFGFLLVAPTATDKIEDLRAALKENGIVAPCARDVAALTAALGARATTDVFVIDAARTLVYRGAIDDQYGLGYSLDAPRHRYLADALESLIAGRPPEIAATEAPGCALDLSATKNAANEKANGITFHNRISRILQNNCLECHRAGGVAPFSLETYEDAIDHAGMIRKMVSGDLMPPWFAARPAAGAHSPWLNDRSLAERDKADLLAWVAAGKPEGDKRDAPLARTWPGEWRIGTPDAVVQIPQPVSVKAEGTMPYQNVIVDTNFSEEKWVRAFEVQPTAREVVHHVLVFVVEPGKLLKRARGEEGDADGFFAAYVPGNSFEVLPDGFAKHLPAGAKLRFQIHYTPNGKATQDQVRIGLIFSKKPPRHVVHVAGIANYRIAIPPGASDHAEVASIPVPRDATLLGFMPHMHVRGKAFRYEAVLPGGEVRTLLDVPRYDFNWQLACRYAEPPTLPAGSQIRATGWFDNSAANPANPDPNKLVKWGPQTFDEMMLGYVEFYWNGEPPHVALNQAALQR